MDLDGAEGAMETDAAVAAALPHVLLAVRGAVHRPGRGCAPDEAGEPVPDAPRVDVLVEMDVEVGHGGRVGGRE